MQTPIDTDRINGLVNRLVELTEQGVDFSLEQLPEIAREIVTWGIVGNVARVAVFVIVMAVMTRLLLVSIRWYGEWKADFARSIQNDESEGYSWEYGSKVPTETPKSIAAFVGLVVCPIVAAISLILATDCAAIALKAIVAPRLYIIEYLQGML